MANKRMFSKNVVCTRSFLEMPPSSRALYYQLGVEADDDGFIDPYTVMLVTKSSDDDMKVLLVKGFVLKFESGVIVIRHWKQNNMIRKDTYNETIYKDEKRQLAEGENGEYLQEAHSNVNGSLTQYRLGKDRLGKDRLEEVLQENSRSTPAHRRNEIDQEVFQELATKYEVTVDFVSSCWDSACNWLDANGKMKKDYKAFLSNWVKKERAEWSIKAKRFQQERGAYAVDLTHIR